MTRLVGELGLAAAVLIASIGAVSGFIGWWTGGRGWARCARLVLLAQPGAVSISVAALLVALGRSDMGNAYVAHHTDRALPMVFKLSALWAGQEGSLLLWAWLLAAVGALAAWTRRGLTGKGEPITLAVLAGANLFFCGLLMLAAPPFAPTPRGPLLDGWGLNPTLQHWAMVIHPPTVFVGYGCSAVPFAAAIGVLAGGETDAGWMGGVRRWALASWVCLTAGILLGAWWAYVELGWGGYWAWDPVENASLLPWLAGVALVHTLLVGEERGLFRGWAAGLASLVFVLCVGATALTRSGLLVSVHAFGETTVGVLLLGFLAACVLGAGGLLVWRRRGLRSGTEYESLVSREGVVLGLNVLVVSMIGATMLGTLFPVVSGLVLEHPVSVGAGYYNRVVVPMALAVAALMALGPVLVYGKGAGPGLRRGVLTPGLLTVAGLVVALASGVRHVAALVCVAIALMTVLTVASAFLAAVRTRAGAGARGWLGAASRTVRDNHRRYGGHLAHVGMVLVVVGVCGSGLFAERAELSLGVGESGEIGEYSLEFVGLGEVRGGNYTAMEAVVEVRDRGGEVARLRPQKRYYDKSMDPAGEVAIRSRLGEDLYVALAGWSPGGDRAAFSVLVNPLVAWIWIGGVTMISGGVLCLLPRVRRRANNRVGDRAAVASARRAGLRPPAATGHGKDEAAHVQNSG